MTTPITNRQPKYIENLGFDETNLLPMREIVYSPDGGVTINRAVIDATGAVKTTATFTGTVTTQPTFKFDPTSAETPKYGKVDSDYLLLTGKIYDYQIADEDSATTTKYFGFLKPSGKWYILQQVIGTTNTYRYANGASAYATSWTGRAGLAYGYINTLTGL